MICAYEVEEITTVAETRLPPWAREVFPSVRAHMPWMDTKAGPVELLIGLNNTHWLPVHLEDSRDQDVNMRLMKSGFGHQFMIMGGWVTAFYPRDESMRFRGDPTGERLSRAEMARKIRLERCLGGTQGRSTEDRGRTAIRGPSPPRERTIPTHGQRGARGSQQGRVGHPAPIEMSHNTPRVQGRQSRSGHGPSRGGAVRPQQMRGQPHPDPRGMPGLLQPPGPADTMQRLALMMAVMVLGMPPVHSCQAGTDSGIWGSSAVSEMRVCPPVALRHGMEISATGGQLDPSLWRRLPALRCQATQSVLTFICGHDSQTGKVKFEKFQQPCGIQPAAWWEAMESGRLKVGGLEHPVAMNTTRSHMEGSEGCSGSCGLRAGILNRKITQVLMEVLIEKDWIWWNEAAGKVATASERTASVYREGETVMEDRLRVWTAPSRVGGVDLPADGGGSAAYN